MSCLSRRILRSTTTLRQSEFRCLVKEHLADMFDENDMHDLADTVVGEHKFYDKALDKAASEAYYELDSALKKLSRLAVRMGYLSKGELNG